MARSQEQDQDLVDIVVVSPSSLLAETVRTALAGSGLPASALPWSTEADRDAVRRALSHRDGGLLLLVLDPPTRRATQDARTLVRSVPLRSVAVVGGAEHGPEWGAMIDAGAEVVLPAGSSLTEVMRVLEDPDSAELRLDRGTRRRLTDEWLAADARETALLEAMATLTPRERTVVQMLYVGASVADVAASTGLARPTVQRALRSMLRKLGVDSELGAVAAYARYLRDTRLRW